VEDTWTLTSGFVDSFRRWCSEQLIILQLTDPDGHALHKDVKQSTGTVSITAKKDGKHEYCFSNLMSSVSDKVVRYDTVGPPGELISHRSCSFNVHGVIFVGEDGKLLLLLNRLSSV
jgi:p24 family protein beta-1